MTASIPENAERAAPVADPAPAAPAGNLLEVRGLSLSFGGLTVLDEVSLDVPEG